MGYTNDMLYWFFFTEHTEKIWYCHHIACAYWCYMSTLAPGCRMWLGSGMIKSLHTISECTFLFARFCMWHQVKWLIPLAIFIAWSSWGGLRLLILPIYVKEFYEHVE